jgi:hypothetical protein
MHARTGVKEAFQQSDVAVPMVAESMIIAQENKKDGRYCRSKHAVVVDGKETQQLDSLLGLVNTAMLSHEGSFAGKVLAGSSVKRNGRLSNKARKAILKAMDDDDDDDDDDDSQHALVLELICDFSILPALDEGLDYSASPSQIGLEDKRRGRTWTTVWSCDLKSILV